MTDKKITSVFFSERNFLAIVEAVQGWTLKTYRHHIDKVYNETILEIMKRVFSQRAATHEMADVDDCVLTLNKQVLRQTLETISRDVNTYAMPDRMKAAEQFRKGDSIEPPPRSGFRLGEDHIIPKTNETSLPSEDPGGENNTMELYESESRRRQAEIEAAPDLKVPMVNGSDMLLPTIYEQEEEEGSEPEFLNVFQAEPGLPSSLQSISQSVSDQAASHIQAIHQTQSHVPQRDIEQHSLYQIPTRPALRIGESRPERPKVESISNDSLQRLQDDLHNLTKKMDSLLECIRIDREGRDAKVEPPTEQVFRRTNVFSSADRDFERYSGIDAFELDLKGGGQITRLLIPRCINTMPYIRVTLDDDARVVDIQEFGQDFLKAEIKYRGAGSVSIAVTDLNGRAMYPNACDVVKVSAVQVRDDHLLVETGLHLLREGDTIRFLDVESSDPDLKRELTRPKGFAVSIVDHVHFVVTELTNLKGDDLYVGSILKLKQQVLVEYYT